MSKAKELLLECKVKLGIKTDYKLAQALEIDRSRVSDYMSEKRVPDAYAAIRMALILQRNPAEIIAEIEADTEKNEKRRAFWRDFVLHIRQSGKLYVLALVFTASFMLGLGEQAKNRDGFFRA